MKRLFLIVFVCINISFLFLQIYKQSRWAAAIYAQQQREAEKKELLIKKDAYVQTLCMLKEPNAVKRYAQSELGMVPVRLQQIKTLQVFHGT